MKFAQIYWRVMRKDLETPHRSLLVGAGVVVGLKEQGATLTQSGRDSNRQRGGWEVH